MLHTQQKKCVAYAYGALIFKSFQTASWAVQISKLKACKIKDEKVVANLLMMFDLHIFNNNEKLHTHCCKFYLEEGRKTHSSYQWEKQAGL